MYHGERCLEPPIYNLYFDLNGSCIFLEDRKALKDLEDQIVNGEISPDDVTADVIREEENIIDSTTPEKKAIVNTRGGFSGKRQKVCFVVYVLHKIWHQHH